MDMVGVGLMELVLHLGAHCSGHLGFQKFLAANTAALSQEGIATALPAQTKGGMLAGLMVAQGHETPLTDHAAHRSAGLMRLHLADLTRQDMQLLLLSEPGLLGNVALNLTSGQLYPDAAWRLARMRNTFERSVTRICLTIRSYECWWMQQLAAGMFQGHALPTEAQLDRLVTQPRRWRHLAQELRDAFPAAEILILPHEALSDQHPRMLALLTGAILADPVTDFTTPADIAGDLAQLVADRDEDPGTYAGQLHKGGTWMPFPNFHREVLQDAYREDLTWLRGQADNNITLIENTGAHPGQEDERGHNDGFKEERAAARNMGDPGRERTAGASAG
ncbi:hypothetical protein [Halocynthiibacter styelae]|uniref:Uncharacterized protein n=1 Tax=Halocynthiibacter styelae TaxID=2761955 RepID=A0A8J7J8I1_9RHOB|nr:hypothetical protein [Paenihalocynthiibacter styelae]MBI1495345.1 hypothetical protein [Paenihalocynthiibacter styelae]